jgi:hypothetical protein
MEEEPTPAQFLDDILYHLAVDNDRDVRFFISEFIHPDTLEAYQKRKAVEALAVAHTVNDQEETGATAITESSSPPTPPVHTIIVQASEEEPTSSTKDLDSHNDKEISEPLAESPMDIVVDDEIEAKHAMEEEKSPIDQTMHDEKSTVDHAMCDEKSVVDHTMGDHESEAPLKTTKAQDEDVTMLEDDIDTPNDYQNVPEKAQHVYLSKVPAHVVAEKDIMTPTTAVTQDTLQ